MIDHGRTYLGLLALLEESLLGLLLGGLVLGEVILGGDLLKGLGVNSGDIDTGAGGDNVAGVDTAEGNTVDLEGAGDEEDTLVEVLEENDTLATEAASEEDQDGTGLEALAQLGGTDSLADLYDDIPSETRFPSLKAISTHSWRNDSLKDRFDSGGR